MNCPCCNTEMERGFLQGGRMLLWAKRRHKLSLLPRDEDVVLGENYFAAVTLKAYICKQCKKVLVDYTPSDPAKL